MYIHEYQAKKLLSEAQLPVAQGYVANSPVEAEFAFRKLMKYSKVAVIKAQVHAGGRGEGGGVKLVKSPEEAYEVATALIGSTLITRQTGSTGKKVHTLYVEAGCEIKQESYLCFSVDRATSKIVLLYSREGGMDIEDVAQKSPEKLLRLSIDPDLGIRPYHIWQLQYITQMPLSLIPSLRQLLEGLFKVFVQFDLMQLEINPLAQLADNSLLILDAKFDFDDNALFRHPQITDLRDYKEEDASELEASKHGLSYVGLDGDIGCLVNGAGLAMATMDIIKLHGGKPLNFLDVGGGASKDQVKNAIDLIQGEPGLKAILVNIFGGIMHCDVIAEGLVSSVRELGGLQVPLVVRLEGTRVAEGCRILEESGIEVILVSSMDEGAKKVVELATENS